MKQTTIPSCFPCTWAVFSVLLLCLYGILPEKNYWPDWSELICVCCSQGFSVKLHFPLSLKFLFQWTKASSLFDLQMRNSFLIENEFHFLNEIHFLIWNSFKFNFTCQYWENLLLLQQWQLWHKFATCSFNLKDIIQPKS